MGLPMNGSRGQHRPLYDGSGGHPAGFRMGICHTLCILVLLGLLPGSAPAGEGRGYFDGNGGYKTGDFGTAVRSNLYYFSPSLGYVTPHSDFSITIPYLFLTNKTAGQTATEEGLGDVILRGGKVLFPETQNGFSLTGLLALKLATADENKGLGTGETDYAGFLSIRQRVGKNRYIFSAGYIKVGDPPGIDFNDVTVFDIGYARMYERTEFSIWYEQRRTIIPGANNPQEINVGFFRILNKDYSIKGSFFAGLNNGGPDFGLNLGLVRWF